MPLFCLDYYYFHISIFVGNDFVPNVQMYRHPYTYVRLYVSLFDCLSVPVGTPSLQMGCVLFGLWWMYRVCVVCVSTSMYYLSMHSLTLRHSFTAIASPLLTRLTRSSLLAFTVAVCRWRWSVALLLLFYYMKTEIANKQKVKIKSTRFRSISVFGCVG